MNKYISIAAIWILLPSCGHKTIKENPVKTDESIITLTEAQFKNAKIAVDTLQQKNISSRLKVNGTIEVPPQNMVSVSVPLGGYLKSSKLLEGMHLQRGETIAVLEDPQYIQLQQDYLTTKAQFIAAEKEYHRQKELNQSKASSDKVLENALAAFTTQKIALKSLSEKLQLIFINPSQLNETNISRSIRVPSPIDGFVSKVHVNIGRYVTPTEVLFELVNPSDIHLQLTLFEGDLDKVFIGQRISAYNNANPEKKYSCEVILISKDVTSERTVQVHCHFHQYDKILIPGMYMNADIEVSTSNSYVIPDEGLVQFEGKHYVFEEVGDKKYKMRPVITGNAENGFTQVQFEKEQPNSNKKFVTKGAYTLLMKSKNNDAEE